MKDKANMLVRQKRRSTRTRVFVMTANGSTITVSSIAAP